MRVRTPFGACLAAGLWAFAPSTAAAKTERPIGLKPGRNRTGFGIGASVGDPMGFSLKWFIRPRHALSGHLAWGLLHHGDGIVSASYHFHSRVIGNSPIVDTHLYVGFGVGLGFWARPGPGNLQTHDRDASSGAALMIRVPAAGITYHWRRYPIDTAIEGAWSPYVVLPDLRHGDVSIKVRYFF